MELNHAALAGFRTRWETMFNQAYNLAEPQTNEVAHVFNSGRVETVTHRWLRGIAGMREFTDERVVNNVDSNGFSIQNKLWEDTIGIRRVDLERDQYRLYDPMISRLGQTAKLHRDTLVFPLLSDAVVNPSSHKDYTGVDNFYGTHTTGRSTAAAYTNYASSTGSQLSEASLQTAITSLRNRRDSAGNLLSASRQGKPLLVIPPALEFTAAKLANVSFYPQVAPGASTTQSTSNYAASGENVLKGTFDYIVCPYLTTTTEWHLFLRDSYYRPVIFQVEQEIEMLPWDKFIAQWSMKDQFIFGVRALYNVALGLPEMAYGSKGA